MCYKYNLFQPNTQALQTYFLPKVADKAIASEAMKSYLFSLLNFKFCPENGGNPILSVYLTHF